MKRLPVDRDVGELDAGSEQRNSVRPLMGLRRRA